MQCFDIISFTDQRFRYFLCICLCPCKNYPIKARIKIDGTFERLIPVYLGGDEILMINIVGASIYLPNGNFEWLLHVSLTYLSYLGRHSSAEQPRTLTVWCVLKNKLNVILKTHIEHFISLIQNHIVNVFKIDCFALYKIDQTAGRRNYDMGSFFQVSYLHSNRSASINGYN